MTFLVLTIDSSCFKIEADHSRDALIKLFNQFDTDDWEEFLKEINLIEWEENGRIFLQNYFTKNIQEIEKSRLTSYLKIKQTKRPVKELEEEFEEL